VITHNGQFDIIWLRSRGVDITSKLYGDTKVVSYLLDENVGSSLKVQALAYGFGDYGLAYDSIPRVSLKILARYNATDSLATAVIFKDKYPALVKAGQHWLAENIVIPAMRTLSDMEYRGVKIDLGKVQPTRKEYTDRMQELLRSMREYPQVRAFEAKNGQFNPRSTQHVRLLLFDPAYFGLTPIDYTLKGLPSTNSSVIGNIDHPFIPLLQEYRRAGTMVSTYLDGLLARVDDAGFLHTSYSLTTTVTGRLASRDPNLQNIPRKAKGGIKKLFVSEFEDGVIVEMDYSQIELRVACIIARDEAMREIYLSGKDIHAETASAIFGKPPEEISGEERVVAKTVNFGILYGISPKGLSERLNISEEEAKEYIKRFFGKFKGVAAWVKKTAKQATEKGIVVNLFGRVRHLYGDDVGRIKRQAVNAPIQSSASDITLYTLHAIWQALRERGMKSRPVLTVHDSIVLSVSIDELRDVLALSLYLAEQLPGMEHFPWYGYIPIKADVAVGRNWGELVEIER
jgi:DNA polymerase-1